MRRFSIGFLRHVRMCRPLVRLFPFDFFAVQRLSADALVHPVHRGNFWPFHLGRFLCRRFSWHGQKSVFFFFNYYFLIFSEISLFKSFSIGFLCADFQKNFYSTQCQGENAIANITNSFSSSLTFYSWNETRANGSAEARVDPNEEPMEVECNQASSVLFLLLMLGTVWLGVSIFNFKKT